MSWSAWSAGVAVIASVLFLARLLPQPLRTLRTGQVAGLSALAALNACVADGAWLAYGLSAGVLAVWLVSIPALLTSGATVVALRVVLPGAVRGRDLLAASMWLGVVGLCALTGTLTVALSLTVVVTCGPAVWTAFSSRSPVGVSRWTWWLATADALSWGGYGMVIGDGALELYGVVLLSTAVAMLLRLRSAGYPAPAVAPSPL